MLYSRKVSFHASWHAFQQSFTLLLGDYAILGSENLSISVVFNDFNVFLLNPFQRFSIGFGSGGWAGHDGVLR